MIRSECGVCREGVVRDDMQGLKKDGPVASLPVGSAWGDCTGLIQGVGMWNDHTCQVLHFYDEPVTGVNHVKTRHMRVKITG